MAFRSHANGAWVVLGKDPETGEETKLKLRPILQSEHLSINRKMGFREGAAPDVVARVVRHKARLSVLDSERFEVVPETEEDAETFCKALGHDVEAGEAVCLDGRWSAAVADALFDRVPIQVLGEDDAGKPRMLPLEMWIVLRADKLGAIEGAREEALGKA
jgi:hypothetical protein